MYVVADVVVVDKPTNCPSVYITGRAHATVLLLSFTSFSRRLMDNPGLSLSTDCLVVVSFEYRSGLGSAK